MSVKRVFFVTQGSLNVWLLQDRMLSQIASFADDDDGLQRFDTYVAAHGAASSAMLVDVIEEEFALEVIPKLGFRDRKALIERRAGRRFRRTPYRVSDIQGKANTNKGEFDVMISAISNHELVEPWIQTLLRHQSPLTGVYSVPHIAPGIFERLFTARSPTMFVAPHQGTKLRQVFLRDGYLRGARLSQINDTGDDAFAKLVVTETLRSRQYFERTRLLSLHESLSICVIADTTTQQKILELYNERGPNQFFFIDPAVAAKKTVGRRLIDESHFEEIYLSSVMQRRPHHSYAVSGENRYWHMSRLRSALIGVGVAVAAVCSVASAIFLQDAWMLHNRVANIEAQVGQLSETFRRENESFDPIRADSYEMKQAVDTGDYILANRVPVPWVLNQLGQVMGDYSDIRLRELRWIAESGAREPVGQGRANEPMPVNIPAVRTVSAVLTAEIVPFDGNLRTAFSRIDELAADIQLRTRFDRAFAMEYPIDTRTSASVTGEIDNRRVAESAEFRLRVVYQVPGSSQQNLETENDGV